MPINRTIDSVGRVLLTRPAQKNQQLAAHLHSLDFETVSCPMIEIVPISNPKTNLKLQHLSDYDLVIAVSAHAVNYTNEQIKYWPDQISYYAIGMATATAMSKLGLSPELPQQSITESLLLLKSLQSISGKKILILRGVGGRETLAQQLQFRGAQVDYCEVYQRQAIKYQRDILVDSWKNHQVKTIVVTSGEILKNLLTLVGTLDKQWLVDCNIVVPSQRVAVLAESIGFKCCLVASGADNDAISQTLMKIQSNINEKKT